MLIATILNPIIPFEYEFDHKIQLQYNKSVTATLGPEDISLTNLTTNQQLSASQMSVGSPTSDRYPVSFQNLPGTLLSDGNYELTVNREGVFGDSDAIRQGLDRNTSWFVFKADINHDRVVDSADQTILQANWGAQNVGFSSGNLNYDHIVDINDFGLLAGQFGVSLPVPPGMPGISTAYAESYTSIRINWYPSSDPGVDGYRIFRSTDSVDFTQVAEIRDPQAATWVNDTGLTHGTKYWYRVRAFSDEAGNSASTYKYSEVTPMPPPTDLAISDITDGGLTLIWTDNTENESNYVILRYSGTGEHDTWYELPANTTSYRVDDLEENTTYQWRVYAYNDVCDSMSTLMQTATTLSFQPPSHLRLMNSVHGLAAWWEDYSDIETAYELTFTNPGQSPQTLTVPANQTNVILPGASADATVSLRGLNGSTSSSSASVMKRDDEVYFDDFTNPSEGFADHSWSGGDTNSYLWNAPGVHVRGLFGDDSSVSLTLSNLPAHSELNFEFGLVYVPDLDDPGDPQFAFGLSDEEASIDHSLGYLTDAGLTSEQFSQPRTAWIYATSDYLDPVHVTHHGNEATVRFVVTGLNANEYWAIHGIRVTCDTPIAGIATVWNDDYAIEGSPAGDVREKAGLIVHRYFGDSSEPLPVTLNILGSETTAAANDYSGFSNQLVIPASEGDEIMEVAAVDDDTPEWTETLTVQLAPDPERFFYNPGFEKAKVEFVDDDLGISDLPEIMEVNNDDDNQNNVPDRDETGTVVGEDDLIMVSLDFPESGPAGSTITLSAPNLAHHRIHVWENEDRSGEQFIKDDRASFTWTIGVNDPPQQVWVEPVGGSGTVGDIVLTLQATEGTSGTQPATHPTTTQATTNWVTAYGIAIKWQGQDVTNRGAGDALIGQKINLTMEVVGPWVPADEDYLWTVPVPTFKDYIATTSQGIVIPLEQSDVVHPSVTFYWSDGDTAGDEKQVYCAVKIKPGLIEQRWTKFKVFEPTSQFELLTANVGLNRNPVAGQPDFGLFTDQQTVNNDPRKVAGMVYTAKVGLPSVFAGGQQGGWYITQRITSWNYAQTQNGANWRVFRNGESRLLDTVVRLTLRDPTNAYVPIGDTASTGGNLYAGVDSPGNPLLGVLIDDANHAPSPMIWTQRDDEFDAHLMFIPPGADSKPVPLKRITSIWGGAVFIDPNNGNWVEDAAKLPYKSPNPQAVDANEHPTWPKNKAPTGWEFFIP